LQANQQAEIVHVPFVSIPRDQANFEGDRWWMDRIKIVIEPFQYADWVGAAGVFLLLLAFTLNLFDILDLRSLRYSLANFVGASLATYASWLIAYMPFVVLEGVWACVSLVAVLKHAKWPQAQRD
jgi:hypothetical protein